jgi:hypothetical protein
MNTIDQSFFARLVQERARVVERSISKSEPDKTD